MSKEKRYNDSEEGGKLTLILIVFLIIVTWFSVMALMIKCDVGGFGSEVLRPIFKEVPVIKEILPPASDEEVAKESDYPYDTLEKALNQITVLEQAIGSKDAEISSLTDRKTELEQEVSRLSIFEKEQSEFEEEKNKFFDEIVYGNSAPDTDTYVEWYNSIDAEHAEEIYKEIVEAKQVDQEILDLAVTYEAMKADAAAEILESMSNDLDTVALIMNNMGADARGKILAEMDPSFAASVTKKLLP